MCLASKHTFLTVKTETDNGNSTVTIWLFHQPEDFSPYALIVFKLKVIISKNCTANSACNFTLMPMLISTRYIFKCRWYLLHSWKKISYFCHSGDLLSFPKKYARTYHIWWTMVTTFLLQNDNLTIMSMKKISVRPIVHKDLLSINYCTVFVRKKTIKPNNVH